MATDSCAVCGAEFPRRPRKLTCSRACAKLRAKQLRPARTPGRRDETGRLLVACVECGAEFHAVRGRRTCSDACARQRKRRTQRESKRREWTRRADELRARQRDRRRANLDEARRRERERKRKPPPVATCRRCGQEFIAQRRDARYCSDECVAPVTTLSCLYCGVEFRGRRGQKYCTPRCARRGWTEQRRKRLRAAGVGDELALAALAIERGGQSEGKWVCTCTVCGGTFRSQSAHAATCSDDCRREYNRQWKRDRSPGRRPLPDVACAVCGELFAPDRRNAKLCSAECRAEDKRRKMRERARQPTILRRNRVLARRRKGIVRSECSVCGRDLTGLPDLRVNRYTCSPECRSEARRRRNRRVYERRRDREKNRTDKASR